MTSSLQPVLSGSYGNLHIIRGNNDGRFPYCNSIFIDDSTKVIIDPGAGLKPFQQLIESKTVDLVVNTHFHFDHIVYNYLFSGAEIYINDLEAPCFRDRTEIARRLGLADIYGNKWVADWLSRISSPDTPQSPYTPQNRHEWWLSTAHLHGSYRWGDTMDFGDTAMKVIGTPGHSAGFCCLHFPKEGVVYTGDIDMTAFGPWYFGADGDIDQFIESARALTDLDADTFVTGHESGILGRTEFLNRMEDFLDIINTRDALVLNALSGPLGIEELKKIGLFYGKKFLVDSWVQAWEEMAIRKHLERLVKQGQIDCHQDIYRRL